MTLENILKEEKSTLWKEAGVILNLSLPAILAQLTSIAMQYIDAGMVGSLGANATGAIGLVSTSTWLLGGACLRLSTGFTVQVAQLVGAGENKKASEVFRQGLLLVILVGISMNIFGVSISGILPRLLGGAPEVLGDATRYFMIYSCTLPFAMVRQLSGGVMQSSGDMKTPSRLAALVCVLDVIFNLALIFPTRTVSFLGRIFMLPGAGLGVTGAALGTALAEIIVAFMMLYSACVRNKKISFREHAGSWKWKKSTIQTAMKVALPMVADQIFMCSAYVAGTVIVAPLGTVALAANSLAVTAESLCYMPGYGVGAAATAIIGQTIGADRRDLTRSFSRLSVGLGMVLMGSMAFIMYFFAPTAFSLLTSDAQVAEQGVKVLRIVLLAEPLYGASICCAGVFSGAGDTLVPSVLNLVSMWFVRILLASFLVPKIGLSGYWAAMSIELCFRGLIFLIRLSRNKWMKAKLV